MFCRPVQRTVLALMASAGLETAPLLCAPVPRTNGVSRPVAELSTAVSVAISNEVVQGSASLEVEYRVTHWTAERGLPQNAIKALLQTRDGYLWIGTLNGLARFDGVRFKVFDHNNTSEMIHES